MVNPGKAATRKPPKRKRDPDGTREAILEAGGKLLAKDGPEGLTVTRVAQLAGVNRGTAYQHFQTREQLTEATTAWVSNKLCLAVFGDPMVAASRRIGEIDPRGVTEHLIAFSMENPELGRAWLFELLRSSHPASDPFWKLYKSKFDKFAKSELAQPGIDTESHSVLVLVGAFLWPVWARAHAHSPAQRQKMAKRYSDEVLRLSLHGTMRPEKFRQLDAKLPKAKGGRLGGK